MAADARAHLVAEAERGADFQSLCQIDRIEGGHRRLAVDLDRDLEERRAPVGIAVRQRELAALVPIEAHRAIRVRSFAEGPQPGNDSRTAVMRDDCELV